MPYTLVFRILIVALYLAQQSKLVIRPDCSALYTSVYKFICNCNKVVFSTATKQLSL